MANPTTNYSFAMPTNTDLVKDLPADFEVFGQAVDTQMKTNADAAVVKSTFTTKGDLIAATGASTPARLGIGTNGQVLTADSAEASGVKWATASSGGMTLITETTASALSSLSFSSISQTYKVLRIEWHGVKHSAGSTRFGIRFNNDSGSNYIASYQQFQGGAAYGSEVTTFVNGGGVSPFGFGVTLSGIQNESSGVIDIYNYASTTQLKHIVGSWGYYNNTDGFRENNSRYFGTYNSTTAISGIDIVRTTGSATFSNTTNTAIRLWGIS